MAVLPDIAQLIAGGRLAQAAGLLCDPDYVERERRSGRTEHLAETAAALEQALLKETGQQQDLGRWQRRLDEYDTQMRAFTDSGGGTPLPAPPPAVPREAYRTGAAPDAFSILELVPEWRQFVEEHAAELANSAIPVFQLAYNFTAAGTMPVVLDERLRQGQGPKAPWLRLLNRQTTPWRAGSAGSHAPLALAFFPDGRRLAVVAESSLVTWDWTRNEQRAVAAKWSYTAALAADGRRAVRAYEGRIQLAALDPEPACGGTVEIPPHTILAVSLDFAKVVLAHRFELEVWGLAHGTRLGVLRGHTSEVKAAALTWDGRRAVSVSFDHSLRVWDLESGRCLRHLPTPDKYYAAVAATPDGRLAVAAGWKTFDLWDLETGASSLLLPRRAWAVALTPDGQRAAALCDDGSLRVVDVPSRACCGRFSLGTSPAERIAITADGRFAATGHQGGLLRVWNLLCASPQEQAGGISAVARHVVLLPDRCRVAAAGADGRLYVWDVEAETCQGFAASLAYAAHQFQPTPDGRFLVLGHHNGVEVVDLENGRSRRFTVSLDRPYSLLPTADGSCAAVFSRQSPALLVHLIGGVLLEQPEAQFDAPPILTPDGRWVLGLGGSDATLAVWDLAGGRKVKCLLHVGRKQPGWRVALAPEGRRIIIWGPGMNAAGMEAWDLETRTLVWRYPKETVTCLALSPDGERMLCGEALGSLTLRDTRTGRVHTALAPYPKPAREVAFTPDGQRAMSSSEDGAARLWDLSSGRCLLTWPAADEQLGFRADPPHCAITRSGLLVAAPQRTGLLKLFRLEHETLLAGPPVVTVTPLWRHGGAGQEGRWDAELSVPCWWCGRRVPIRNCTLGDVIACSFPDCGKPLKLNPFLSEVGRILQGRT